MQREKKLAALFAEIETGRLGRREILKRAATFLAKEGSR